MKNWTYAVTFESPETRPPITVRGGLAAGSPWRAASLAIQAARKQAPRIRFENLVVVISPQGVVVEAVEEE